MDGTDAILIIAAGFGVGGWVAFRWLVDKGDKWIKAILPVTVVALAIRLWFFS
ncbi:MAG: hypothetical protein ACLFUB_03335 [Cyclobacteriaceae bacterium]